MAEGSGIDVIKRTTVMVRDAEKAAQWYENVLGMSRWMDTPKTCSYHSAALSPSRTRLIILKANHDLIGMIGLLEWLDPKMDAPEELPTEIKFGVPVFVVASQDARGALERARSLGSRIHCEPREWSVTGADGKVKDMIGCSFWDLDGYFFEVNQTVKVHD